METFVGGRSATPQRAEAYADRHLPITLSTPIDAWPCPEGAEVHMDTGQVLRADVGDWVAEWPTGELVVIPAAVIASSWEGESDEADEAIAKTRADVEVPAAPAGDERIPIAGEPDPYASGMAVGPDGVVEHEQRSAEELARLNEVDRQGDADQPIDEAEKQRLQDELAKQAAEAQAELQRQADAARDAQLISEEEHTLWVAEGEVPNGLSIAVGENGYEVSREPGHDVVGNQPADDTEGKVATTEEESAAQAAAAENAPDGDVEPTPASEGLEGDISDADKARLSAEQAEAGAAAQEAASDAQDGQEGDPA